MKKILPLLSLVMVLVYACNSDDRKLTESTEDDLNTANTFLKASLRGDYTKARTLMLQDSLNVQGIDVYERVYKNMTPEEKSSYASASIRIHDTKKIDSVTTIFHYSNSYRNKVDSIRMVKVNGKWLADLMFRFRQNTDTLFNQ